MHNLKILRREMGLSQQKLALVIDSSQQNIHRYENGFYEPDIKTLKLLADFFDTSIDYLVGRTDIRHRVEPVQPFALNENEAELIEKYRHLSLNARGSIMNMIDALLDENK